MVDRKPPQIADAPGLSWRLLKSGWLAQWRARADLIKRGYPDKNSRLWLGAEPAPAEVALIQSQCQRFQTDMLIWSRGGVPMLGTFDGTVRALIAAYETDPDSPYHKTRYRTRIYYGALCKRLNRDCGDTRVAEIKARTTRRLYETWAEGGLHIPRAHSLISMLRTLVNFGAAFLEDVECTRLASVLHSLKFEQAKPRAEWLVADQAIAIRAKAHETGRPSIALAQAFQFDLMLRQKDVIGEWVPVSEPGISAVTDGPRKWLRGLRWDEIDANWILKHVTSKRQKSIEVNLTKAPMVMEELGTDRSKHPTTGPVIVQESTKLPWTDIWFRVHWRRLAKACGIPASVRNMDSRAGAITEATEAGADLEHIKHAATHGDISMTQRYARGATEKTAKVMDMRAAHRNKKET